MFFLHGGTRSALGDVRDTKDRLSCRLPCSLATWVPLDQSQYPSVLTCLPVSRSFGGYVLGTCGAPTWREDLGMRQRARRTPAPVAGALGGDGAGRALTQHVPGVSVKCEGERGKLDGGSEANLRARSTPQVSFRALFHWIFASALGGRRRFELPPGERAFTQYPAVEPRPSGSLPPKPVLHPRVPGPSPRALLPAVRLCHQEPERKGSPLLRLRGGTVALQPSFPFGPSRSHREACALLSNPQEPH